MRFDYISNLLITKNCKINLDDLRAYLLEHHETLCTNHFIKAITVKGKTVMSFDWESIFSLADKQGVVDIFLQTKLN